MGLRDMFKRSGDDDDSQYKYDVFISYSTKNKDIADAVCHVLEQNALKCWIAPRNISSGSNYVDQIVQSIKNSAIQVLIFSGYSMASQYVLNEVEMAFQHNKPIIAFKIDESIPDGKMNFFLKNKHWIDASHLPESQFGELVNSVFEFLGRENDNASPSEGFEGTLRVKNKLNRKSPDVYVSYSESDLGAVGEICDALEDHNISCFLRDRHSGQDGLAKATGDAIDNSRAFVLVYSRHCKDSSPVRTEVDMAFSRDIPIICFKIDKSKLDGGLEFFLKNKHWIDANSNIKDGLNTLIEDVLRIMLPLLMDSSITFSSTSADVLIGDVIVLSGSLNGESGMISGAKVDICQNGELVDTVMSSRNGRFSAVIPADDIGSYDFKAIFKGNDEYSGCQSESLTVDVSEDTIHDQSHNDAIDTLADMNEDEGFLNLTDEDIEVNDESIPHVDLVPFPAYDGDDAYAFVSYSHRDYEVVYEEIERFYNQGLNVWYDEGIAPGNEWLAEIAEALYGASLFIVFISNNAVGSRFVRKEITFAINNDIPFIAIHIEKTNLPLQLNLALGDLQAILKYGMNDKEYYRRYTKAFNRILKDHGIILKRVESLGKPSQKDDADVSSDVRSKERPEEEQDYSDI